MNKVVALLAFTALVAGCKSLGGSSGNPIADAHPVFRCAAYFDQPSLSEQQLNDIRALSRRDNGCKLILGRMYEAGRGVPRDIPQAKTVYQSLAEVEPRAYNRLGAMAEQGIGGPVDLVAARDFYQRAVSKPGNTDIEFKLAEFMENGKGGPEDLQGALKYYLSSAGALDAAWSGVQRLRAQGVPMTTAQQKRYNEIFGSSVYYRLRKKIEYLEETLKKERMTSPDSQPVSVKLEGIPGVPVPTLSLVQSSGNSAVDQKVLQGFADYRFPGEPIIAPDQKTYWLISTVRTDGKTELQRLKDLMTK